ncbi:MAG: PKD domain-containing protein [Planctomycetota bacterium]
MKVQLLLGTALFFASVLPPRVPDSESAGAEASPAEAGRLHSHLAFARWTAAYGEGWRLVRDEESGFARLLFGGAAPAAFAPAGEGDFALLARQAVADTLEIHGIDPSTLRLDRVRLLPLGAVGGADKTTVRFRQELGGVPVIGGTVNVLLDRNGRLLSIDSQAIPATDLPGTAPTLDAAAAAGHARAHFLADTGLAPTRMGEPELGFERLAEEKRVVPRLVWEVEVHRAGGASEPAGYTYRLDAASGLVTRRSVAVHHDVSGTVQSKATPGAYPDTAGNPETDQPMAHLRVTSAQGNALTDANGDFTIAGASAPLAVTVTYNGTFVTTNDQSTADYSLTTTLSSGSGNSVLMNPSATEYYTAEANSFQWINALRDWTRAVNPADDTCDFTATSNVNLASTCNAYYDGVSVNFYRAGGGCVNTAYSSVVVHEMGHWLNDLYGSGNGSDGFGEGAADVYSMYILDDPIVGHDFCGTGCNVRDGNNTRMFCGDTNPGCYGEVHDDGEPLMGALWKVRARLKTTHGTATGGAVADALFNAWMNAYDDGQIRSIIETHWLILDDDDGDINNGTPNYLDIDGGFRAQGFPGFDLPFVSITNVTQLATTADEVGPYPVNADVYAVVNPPLAGAELRYRVDGGSFAAVPMLLVAGTTHTAGIPGQISPAKVEYYVAGTDDAGNTSTYPSDAPASLLKFFVGVEQQYYFEDFEAGVGGWTHVTNNGAQDDWQHSSQVGSPNGSYGKAGDPPYAYSGTNIWGNDLGASNWDGEYENLVDNSLRSPFLDLSAATGTMLRFRRWLTIESGQWDQGDVLVNGAVVWSNPYATDLIDTSWVEVEADISTWADGNPSVRLEWNLDSDTSVVFGGWNVDDVEVLSIVAAPPTPAFSGAPRTGTAPLAVSFTDESIGNITAWSWSFGDGGTSALQHPNHTYAAAGTYSVTLTVSGPGGSVPLIQADYIEVTDSGGVTAAFTGAPTSGVAPLAVDFTDASTGSVTAWSWTFGDGGTSAVQHPSHTYVTPGTYSVSLTASGPGGSDTLTRIDYITVGWPAPVADFAGAPLAGVAPLAVDFTDTSTGNVTAWDWDFGDTGSSALQHPSRTYVTPGTYTVSLTVTGPGGSDTRTRVDYIVVGEPPPVADFAGGPTSGPAPLTVDFADLSTGTITAWSWSFGDGGTSAAQHPSHTYVAPGTYTVSLTVSGPGGADDLVRPDYITVEIPASATIRNGSGVNPVVFTTVTLPVLGATWSSRIDGGAIGATGNTFIVGYAAPWPGFLVGPGEILVDPTSERFFAVFAPLAGGIAAYDLPVPSDPILAGFPVAAQGYLFNVAGSAKLTNALDLVLGY